MLSWKDIIQDYIIRYSNLIRKVTRPLREHFGISYFTYHRIDEARKYTVLVDRPDWAEHYVSSELFRQDPYLRHFSMYKSGITLMPNNGSQEYKEALIKGAKEVLNSTQGILLIQKQEHHVEFFGFTGDERKSALKSIYLNYPHILSSFASHFRKALAPILTQMKEEASSLVDLKGNDFFYLEPIHLDIALSTLASYYQEIGMTKEVEAAKKLSTRERECLSLLLDYQSTKDSAATLGLSSRTIEFYFENIKNKLSCSTKQELFFLARSLQKMGLL